MNKILNRLTLEEKLRLLNGGGPFSTVELAEHGIPAVRMADGPNGIKTPKGEAVCYPNTCAVACSFDRELSREIGVRLGEDCNRFGVDLLLAPAVNIKRHPLCGRNFEYYSEDPFLTGELAAAFVEGVQSRGVGACVKHFAANNQETRRYLSNSIVDEQTLREIYLKPFQRVVETTGVAAVMSSYNRINGEYVCNSHRLLTDVLRKEWGFSGVVVSDWTSIVDRVKALNAGCDLDMPSSDGLNFAKLSAAAARGEISDDTVNESAGRVLGLSAFARNAERVGVHDGRPLRELIADCTVLLKNEERILPLSPDERILVVGTFARFPRIQGGGCARLYPGTVEVPFDEIAKYAAAECHDSYRLDSELMNRLSDYDRIVVFLGLPEDCESEGYDRTRLDFPQEQTDALKAIAAINPNVVAVLQNGSAVETASWKDFAKGILETYYAGSFGGGALADVLFGKRNPSGKLCESFPVCIEQTPAYSNFGSTRVDDVHYREGLFVGYRWYRSRKIPPSFPFGFGLSYSEFEISNVRAETSEIGRTGVEISFSIENLSQVSGKEVVQFYVRHNAQADRPAEELKQFVKVKLAPNEKKNLKVLIPYSAFEIFDPVLQRFAVFNESVSVLVGTSSADFVAKLDFTVVGEAFFKEPISLDTEMGRLLNDPKTRTRTLEIMRPFINRWAYGAALEERKFEEDPRIYASVCNMPVRSFQYSSQGLWNDEKREEFLKEISALRGDE